MTELLTPLLVEKESIATLTFRNHTPFDQDPGLMEKLKDAARLGNLEKVKFQIDFHSDEGLKSVRTTIWATGNKFICLKGGLWIPISKIVNLRLI